MGVVFAHDVTDDMCALFCWFINGVTRDSHIENDAALNGLQTVTRIRNRPFLDDVFRVNPKTFPHKLIQGRIINILDNRGLNDFLFCHKLFCPFLFFHFFHEGIFFIESDIFINPIAT